MKRNPKATRKRRKYSHLKAPRLGATLILARRDAIVTSDGRKGRIK
jgi:hypothetical protein